MLKGMLGRKMAGSTGLSGIFTIAALLTIFIAGPARATLLDLKLLNYPDIMAGYISLSYTAEDDQFSATGIPLVYFNGVDMEFITGGSYEISADIDEMGDIAGSGTLTITGGISPDPWSLLLEGNLTEFGFQFNDPGQDLFEFLWEVEGGSLAADFGGIGSTIGTIMGISVTGDSSFQSDFSGSFGTSDTAPYLSGGSSGGGAIPEPATLLLLASGLLGLCCLRKKRLQAKH